jgi:rod shape-determining protein MreD
MRKVLIFSLFFYILALAQTSFLFHFNLFGIVPNLILISVVLVNFLEKKEKNAGLIIAIAGGFFLDIFSFLSLGMSITLLLLVALFIKKIIKSLVEDNFFHFVFVLLFSIVFYNFFSVLINSLINFSLPSFFIFNKLIFVNLFYNLAVGSFIYLLILCFRVILEK